MSWASSPSTYCQRSPVTGSRPDIAILLSPRQARTNPNSQWSKRLIDAASLGLRRAAGGPRGALSAPGLDVGALPDRPGSESSGGLGEAVLFAPPPRCVLRNAEEGRDLSHA